MYGHEKAAYPKWIDGAWICTLSLMRGMTIMGNCFFMILREKIKHENSQTIDFVSFDGYTIIEKLK